MRGGSLSHADVIQALRPFIVVAWTGRSERDMPAELRELHFGARNRTSNIHCFVLDAKARGVASFPAFRGNVTDHERMARAMVEEIARASAGMDLPKIADDGMLHLPDIASGVRIILTLKHDRILQYRAPVVECVPIGERERKALAKPDRARDVDASELRAWLEQLMPPGVMDGMGGVKEITGTLSLEPSGLLRGKARLVLDDRNASVCEGTLEGVVTWRDGAFATVRAAFDGIYSKPDIQGRHPMSFAMKAVIESRPN